jgi:hypothetical protein
MSEATKAAPASGARTRADSKPTRGAPAKVAASADDTRETSTLMLFPAHLEYLVVQVAFHGVGVPGLKVRFATTDGTEIAAGLTTDTLGRARAPRRVPAGTYVCEVERQPAATVCTVASLRQGFVLVLPIGRPYSDLEQRLEFDPIVAASGAGGAP